MDLHTIFRYGWHGYGTLLGLIGISCLAGNGMAQTVSVDPTGTADGTTIFTTIQAAVDSFAVGGTNAGNVSENIINVRNDHGPAIGSLLAVKADATDSTPAPIPTVIEEAISIRGVDGAGADSMAVWTLAPLLPAQQTVRTAANPGICWRQAVGVNFKNIAFIPQIPPGADLVKSYMVFKAPAVLGESPVINIENCVFTANDGSNQPITTTGVEADDVKLDQSGVVGLPAGDAAGIYAFSRSERGDLTINLTDCVLASFSTPINGTNPRIEAIKCWQSGPAPDLVNCIVNVNEGCVFANIDGNVAQVSWGGMLNMNGTADKPIVVRNFQNTGAPAIVWLYYEPADDQPVAAEFNYVHFYDCIGPVISEGGVLGDGSRAFINHITNCVFADCFGDAVSLRSGTSLDGSGQGEATLTVDNTVFHNVGGGTGPSAIYGYPSFARTINVTNSIFTDSDGNGIGLFNADSTGTWNVSDSILSLTAPTSLASAVSGTVNLAETVSNEAVTYVNMDDPFSPDFFKVTSSKVTDWSVY